MSSLVIVGILMVILPLIGVSYSIKKNIEPLLLVSLILFIVGNLFTWFIICLSTYKTTDIKMDKPLITKTKISVVVEFNNGEREIFTSHKDYNSINDSTDFYKQINYNHLNLEISNKIIYKNK